MELTQSERAKIVVRYLAKKSGITMFEVGQKLGYTNKSAFSSIIGGEKTLPKKFTDKLAALDPEINPAFLVGKSDEMLRPGYAQTGLPEVLEAGQQGSKPSGVYLPLELVRLFTNLSDTIRSQQETIRLLAGKGDSDAKATS